MSNYSATISWKRDGADFLSNRYSRAHIWKFDGGTEVPASASPQIVPLPLSSEENVDPEEAFVASISSCHMLFYLALASDQGFQIDPYIDNAVGVMARNAEGKYVVSQITLSPTVMHSGESIPNRATQESLHHLAHEQCFIANSVKTKVNIDI